MSALDLLAHWDRVRVVAIADECGDRGWLGREARIVEIHDGTTHKPLWGESPEDPCYVIRDASGARDMFWREELEIIERAQVAFPWLEGNAP